MPPRRTARPDIGQPIFLVHGRAEGPKHAVARFVRNVTGREPIILAEQPILGLITLIENFEAHASKVSFAIALLTADDEGRPRGTKPMHARARQNVILDLGWFAGKLGRNRVAMLFDRGVELPSDLGGVLSAELDSGEGWKLTLARALKAAGFRVNLDDEL